MDHIPKFPDWNAEFGKLCQEGVVSADLPTYWTPHEQHRYRRMLAQLFWARKKHPGVPQDWIMEYMATYWLRCVVCDHDFFSRRPDTNYCAMHCRKQAATNRQRKRRAAERRQQHDEQQPTCQFSACSKPLPPEKRTNAKYCDNACKQNAYRERLADKSDPSAEV